MELRNTCSSFVIWKKVCSSEPYCFCSFLRRPPFIKVNETLCSQLNTFIMSTTTPTAGIMCFILVEPSVSLNPSRSLKGMVTLCHQLEQLPPKYLFFTQSAGAFWHSSGLQRGRVRMRISLCVTAVHSVSVPVHMRSDPGPLWLTVVNYGREEAMRSCSLNLIFFSQSVAFSSPVIMAVLPHSCLFVGGPNRNGGCVDKDKPSCTLRSMQACWPERAKSIQPVGGSFECISFH